MIAKAAGWQKVSCLMPDYLACRLAKQTHPEGVASRADMIRKAVALYLDRAER